MRKKNCNYTDIEVRQVRGQLIMKNLFFKYITVLFMVGSYAILLTCMVACSRLKSEEICGTYRLSNDGVTDTLTLYTNGTFVQTVSDVNGQAWATNGSWEFFRSHFHECVHFDKFIGGFDYDFTNRKVFVVIPPCTYTDGNLWVGKGKLLEDPSLPIWYKVSTNTPARSGL